MKSILLLFAVLFFSNCLSADEVPFDYDPELARTMERFRPDAEMSTLKDFKKYQWLYELIMLEEYKIQESESKKSFSVHLEDSYSFFPHPDMINHQGLKPPGHQSGSITYVGFWPMSYKYDVLLRESGHRVFHVRIHFKNPKGQDLEHFALKIKEAQAMWNDSSPSYDFPFEFLFEVETDPKKAHYSLNILDKTRGPYSVNWSRNWSAVSIAHELGHMMGLSDEYETLSGKMYCLRKSLMCGSRNSKLMPHHYYFILRRLLR